MMFVVSMREGWRTTDHFSRHRNHTDSANQDYLQGGKGSLVQVQHCSTLVQLLVMDAKWQHNEDRDLEFYRAHLISDNHRKLHVPKSS
ncbi:hypothetical protein Hdeb2414_s0009g00316231 [Helianthus debilis subsp. tardiflorus]